MIQISKDVVEGSITPEVGATGGHIVAEEGEVVAEAGQSILIESPDLALICRLLEELLPSVTGKKVRHAVRAQTLRSYQNAGGAVVLTQILKVRVEGSLPVTLDPLTVSLAPNLAVHSDESFLERLDLGPTSQALDLLTWAKRLDPEVMMKAGQSQDSFQKENLLAEEEEDYTVDEVEPGNVAALVQPLFDDQQ